MDEGAFRAAYTWGLVMLCVPAAVANVVVLCSSGLLLGAAEPKAAYMLLGSIALADLATSIFLLAGLVYPHASRTPLLCTLLIGGEVSFSLLSMISIVLIAGERYFYIVHGIQYDSMLSPGRVRLLIFCSWLVALGFGLAPELLSTAGSADPAFHCRFVNSSSTVIIVAASVAIPALLATIILYSIVFIHVRRVTKAIRGLKASRMKFKSIIVVFLSSLCFLITWGPYMVTGFSYAVFCQSPGSSDICNGMALALTSPLALLGFFNSVLNPLIYAWWHRPFNLAIRKILCPKKMREKSRNEMFDGASIETISEKIDS